MNLFPKDLINAFVRNEAVAVIGSGPSSVIGLPNWKSLIQLMIKECELNLTINKQETDELYSLLKTGSFLEIAEECRNRLRPYLYRDFLTKTFDCSSIEPSVIHEKIIQLPFAALLTTNYDTMLEKAYRKFSKLQKDLPVITQKNVAKLAQLPSEKEYFILKLHGDIENIDTIVLTHKDYEEILHQNSAYRNILFNIAATKTLVFIGYGLNDPDLNLMLNEQVSIFRGYGRQHFAFIANAGTIKAKYFLEKYNLRIINYESKHGKRNLHIVINSLNQQIEEYRGDLATLSIPREMWLSQEKREVARAKEIMEHEQSICTQMQTTIPLERAKYLKIFINKAEFKPEHVDLVERSIIEGERKDNEEKILQSQLLHSQRLESLGTLAGGVAHDFNNILGIIIGYSTLISKTKINEQQSKALKAITTAAERATGLVKQLLAFARKSDTVFHQLNIHTLIKEIVQLLSETFPKTISIITDIKNNLPPINGDPSQISQAILNLCINARDAMPNGGTLNINVNTISGKKIRNKFSNARDIEYLTIQIIDNGIGMDDITLNRIFEPFFTTKEIGKGTGLGLAVVYGIIKEHFGYIDVQSQLNKGTTIILLLPIEEKMVSEKDSINNNSTKVLTGTETILFVEDERLLSDYVTGLLKGQGYRIISANDGEQAYKKYKRYKNIIQLVILDMGLPKMAGFDVFKKIKKINSEVRVIFVSGYLIPELKQDLLNEGVSDFLPKPYEPENLLKKIRNILEQKRHEPL
ncbi:MAG: SIR2 family protein [Ignavibacteriae bacterium]|nr:SIR2 family protein [Ignavibacteriota bacterium]